MPAATET